MNKIIEKAAVLVEAMPYFRRFQGETIVVKCGGSIMEDAEGVAGILKDVAFMSCIGLRPVLVHGGGKAITAALKRAKIHSEFLNGLRVTSAEAMRVIEHVLNCEINPHLVEILNGLECLARGIHGDSVITAVKHTEADTETGETLDWGYVGDVHHVDAAPIEAFLANGITPLITPIGRGLEDKSLYNINADTAAVAMAEALKARKLVFLSDVPGLLTNPDDRSTLISSVTIAEVEGMIKRWMIKGGMLPKINGCVEALRLGVRKIHIIDSSVQHSLLLELFTDRGVGTEIIHKHENQ